MLFEYDASRGEEVALRLLEGFQGVLQVDGCPSYNRVCRESQLPRIGCWDHARGKFVEASQAMPSQKKVAMVSKIETAKANGIEPYDYLKYVLKHITSADTSEKLDTLLPWNMKYEIKQ